MAELRERAALVLLLRGGGRSWRELADLVEEAGSALEILQRETAGQASLFDRGASPLESAEREIRAWEAAGLRLLTVLDEGYPENLRTVHDRPPMLFSAGELTPADDHSVAIVGARRASREGIAAARTLTRHLVSSGFTIVSGLAAGIDTAAHTEALAAGGRTIAVIGTGLRHAYPPQNAHLQRAIAARCAVLSQFWPDSGPSRKAFPMRNSVISGLTLATLVVESSDTGGSRLQARLALAQGRPVLLWHGLHSVPWARELARRPGVRVVRSPEDAAAALAASEPGALSA